MVSPAGKARRAPAAAGGRTFGDPVVAVDLRDDGLLREVLSPGDACRCRSRGHHARLGPEDAWAARRPAGGEVLARDGEHEPEQGDVEFLMLNPLFVALVADEVVVRRHWVGLGLGSPRPDRTVAPDADDEGVDEAWPRRAAARGRPRAAGGGRGGRASGAAVEGAPAPLCKARGSGARGKKGAAARA